MADSNSKFEFSSFAGDAFVSGFGNLNTVNDADVRKAAVEYCTAFDPQTWYDNPIHTLLNGESLQEGTIQDTTDPFMKVNGKIMHATDAEIDQVIQHVTTFATEGRDFRESCRAIEQAFVTQHAGLLAGNQALDFLKQDPITEIVEWSEACQVEQRLSDVLFAQEEQGQVQILRQTAVVFCVCNFANFLDLSRKMLRNIELGVPVAVFSRDNTGQHMFRFTELLVALMKEHGVPAGLVTFASCNREGHTRIMQALNDSPAYLTGRREAAVAIKKTMPKLCASTGGPNTMIVQGEMTDNITSAACLSVGIENSGQCTAMRHLITAPGNYNVDKILDHKVVDTPVESVAQGEFGNVFANQKFDLRDSYTQLDGKDAAYRINAGLPTELNENWRNVFLDVSETNVDDVQPIANWLNTFQPISLAVNAPESPYALMLELFERTALVVYTVGHDGAPAYTCQARPQEGEVFGEFPPRKTFSEHTRAAVIVPASTPGCNTVYAREFLEAYGEREFPCARVNDLLATIDDKALRGYCQLIGEYLQCVGKGPTRGFGTRTALFGFQRPPIDTTNVLRVTDVQNAIPYLLCYLCTNAADGLVVSCASEEIMATLEPLGVTCVVHATNEEAQQLAESSWSFTTAEPVSDFILVGHFVGVLFPMGHIKSTNENDEDFVSMFTESRKWLKFLA